MVGRSCSRGRQRGKDHVVDEAKVSDHVGGDAEMITSAAGRGWQRGEGDHAGGEAEVITWAAGCGWQRGEGDHVVGEAE